MDLLWKPVSKVNPLMCEKDRLFPVQEVGKCERGNEMAKWFRILRKQNHKAVKMASKPHDDKGYQESPDIINKIALYNVPYFFHE